MNQPSYHCGPISKCVLRRFMGKSSHESLITQRMSHESPMRLCSWDIAYVRRNECLRGSFFVSRGSHETLMRFCFLFAWKLWNGSKPCWKKHIKRDSLAFFSWWPTCRYLSWDVSWELRLMRKINLMRIYVAIDLMRISSESHRNETQTNTSHETSRETIPRYCWYVCPTFVSR